MKKELLRSLLLTIVFIVLFAVIYPFIIKGIAIIGTSHNGNGEIVKVNGKVVGYELIGQKFVTDRYFNSRPSATGYAGVPTGGSNWGPVDPKYLEIVEARIDSILAQNPEITVEDIPADMVQASGSGIDPHISLQGALMQIPRISEVRNIPEERLRKLVENHTEQAFLGFLGPDGYVHVLKLNVALDKLDNKLENSN